MTAAFVGAAQLSKIVLMPEAGTGTYSKISENIPFCKFSNSAECTAVPWHHIQDRNVSFLRVFLQSRVKNFECQYLRKEGFKYWCERKESLLS